MTASFNPDEYKSFQVFLEKACGIVLGENKHYLVSSRLTRLMRDQHIASLQDLVKKLESPGSQKLRIQVIEAMTTNETLWFRDTYPFEVLSQTILTEFKNEKKSNVRIWSAACSSGQEPYSISMITDEFSQQNPFAPKVEIVATDISQAILAEAQSGKYDALALARGLSEERKRRYFSSIGNQSQVNANIRARVTFREGNLLQSYAALGRFDVIFCRNVLIYFSAESKKDIISRMAKALNPRGYLMLGASESIAQYSDAFEMVRASTGVVYRLKH
ncbi:MAG: protein-glutamate O-methyltransferase CheR [Gammaproteobacteria bacterium]|nr:protein-glutamate O-methyltransferase CheR [Gammaproteobacteria bacterium]MDH5736621.1 protein-glutamate O-methyltransferase CheR [Gammaproteobacteria bacterium]